MKKRKKYLLGIVVVLLLVSGSYYFIKRYPPYIAKEILKTIKTIPYSLFRNDIFLQHN